MRSGLTRHCASETLQAWPGDFAIYGSPRAEHDRARALQRLAPGKHDPAQRPIGPLLGLLISVGRWVPDTPTTFGPFTVTPRAETEDLIGLAPLKDWLAARSLQVRAFRPAERPGVATVSAPFLPESTDGVTFRGTASRKTHWRPHAGPLPAGAFVDDRRGLHLEQRGSTLVMSWFHHVRGDVFAELASTDPGERRQQGFVDTVMVRSDTPLERKAWFRADETVFPL